MTSRDVVLGRIAAALGHRPPVHAPALPVSHAPADLDLFCGRVNDYRAQAIRVGADAATAAIHELLSGRLRVVVPAGLPEFVLRAIPESVRLPDDPPLTHDQLDAADAVVTTCAAAIAETGTVILDAGPGQGRRALSLLPDVHVVIVPAEHVVATVGQALARLDPRRPQTWISGPSATSDIELVRVEGVHGPRTLHVVVVEPSS
jgi:L-lactate dehydrogenase complex protein LldG